MDLEYRIEITEPVTDPRIHLYYRLPERGSRWRQQFDGRFTEFRKRFRDLFDSKTLDTIKSQKPYKQFIYQEELKEIKGES